MHRGAGQRVSLRRVPTGARLGGWAEGHQGFLWGSMCGKKVHLQTPEFLPTVHAKACVWYPPALQPWEGYR